MNYALPISVPSESIHWSWSVVWLWCLPKSHYGITRFEAELYPHSVPLIGSLFSRRSQGSICATFRIKLKIYSQIQNAKLARLNKIQAFTNGRSCSYKTFNSLVSCSNQVTVTHLFWTLSLSRVSEVTDCGIHRPAFYFLITHSSQKHCHWFAIVELGLHLT